MDKPTVRILLSALFLISVVLTGVIPRASFDTLLISYGISFGVYLLVIGNSQHWTWWLGIGVIARVLLIFTFPNLSDDIYRFFWDGTLSLSGISPYAYTPEELVNQTSGLPAGLLTTFPLLNSPSYYSVYPIVCQMLFFIGALGSGGDPLRFSLILKLLFLLCECGSLWMLFRLIKSKTRLLVYALNPLVLIELVGNLHFEAIMIVLILTTLFLFRQQKYGGAVISFACAIATKLVPLIFLPFMWSRMNRRAAILFTSGVALVTLFLFVPVFGSGHETGFVDSIDLYFRTFEFNASIYYLLRWIGTLYYGYNPITLVGPLSAGTAAVLILMLAWRYRKANTELTHLLVPGLSIYFFFATTVHPWYLCTLVALCALTRLRFPIIWSGAAFLSYSAYREGSDGEILWLVAAEYVLVLWWIARDWSRLRPSEK